MHYMELKQFRARTWGTSTNLLIKTPRHTVSVSQFQKYPIKAIQGQKHIIYYMLLAGEAQSSLPLSLDVLAFSRIGPSTQPTLQLHPSVSIGGRKEQPG